MDISLLEKIRQKIVDEPWRLDMQIYKFGQYRCIAGFILDLTNTECPFGLENETAAKLLGITMPESFKLFTLVGWPQDLRDKYVKAMTTKQNKGDVSIRAQATIERINLFINNYGI